LPQQPEAAFFTGHPLFVEHDASDFVVQFDFGWHAACFSVLHLHPSAHLQASAGHVHFSAHLHGFVGHLHSSAHLQVSAGQVHFSAHAHVHASLAGSADWAIP
jgi:hypothetical protein